MICAIWCASDLLANYGPQKLNLLKPFYKEIEKQALSVVPAIRSECMNFYKAAIKWLGEEIISQFT